MVKVSVVVPIYNAESYLVQCLDSIINQTLPDIEIILVNDGSTDNSALICQKYLDVPRVRYIAKENEGLAAARHDGINAATGEYVGFVDSDDWIELNMYETMYAAAKNNDADIVFCNCIENENGHRFTPEMPSGPYNRQQILDVILPRTLAYIDTKGGKRAIRWSNCLRIYKLALLRQHGINLDKRFRRSQDLQLTYEATLVAKNYYYLGDNYLYHNRVVGNSLSRGYTKNMWPLYKNLIKRLYQVTEQFKEMDLLEQMHLRAFFFVTDCIDNEFKPTCPNDETTKLRLIQEIMDDQLCERFYGHIPIDRLNPVLKKYYELILEKSPKGIIAFRKKCDRQQSFLQNAWKPFVNWLTENRITGTIYKAIRKRK